jgi:hypothetical protein
VAGSKPRKPQTGAAPVCRFCIGPTPLRQRADGTALRLLYLSASAGQAYSTDNSGSRRPSEEGTTRCGGSHRSRWKGDGDVGRQTRKPLLLLRLSGWLVLRAGARALLSMLFHEPPRNTRRAASQRTPQGEKPCARIIRPFFKKIDSPAAKGERGWRYAPAAPPHRPHRGQKLIWKGDDKPESRSRCCERLGGG